MLAVRIEQLTVEGLSPSKIRGLAGRSEEIQATLRAQVGSGEGDSGAGCVVNTEQRGCRASGAVQARALWGAGARICGAACRRETSGAAPSPASDGGYHAMR